MSIYLHSAYLTLFSDGGKIACNDREAGNVRAEITAVAEEGGGFTYNGGRAAAADGSSLAGELLKQIRHT